MISSLVFITERETYRQMVLMWFMRSSNCQDCNTSYVIWIANNDILNLNWVVCHYFLTIYRNANHDYLISSDILITIQYKSIDLRLITA